MDFGCKRIDPKDLIKCTFGLNKTELELFLLLSKGNKCETVQNISKSIGLDRTTIQKSLKKLITTELVERKQVNLENGGYVFFYCIKKKPQIKEKMQNILDEWYSSAKKEITYIFGDTQKKDSA